MESNINMNNGNAQICEFPRALPDLLGCHVHGLGSSMVILVTSKFLQDFPTSPSMHVNAADFVG